MLPHTPVLLQETLQALGPGLARGRAIFLDGTFGGGGSSFFLAQHFPHLRIIGLDRDRDATGQELPQFSQRIQLIHGNFEMAHSILAREGITQIHGALLDLGVSSHQLETPGRGFSFREDAPLDMRMDQSSDVPLACDLLNHLPVKELERIFHTYGQERFFRKVARKIAQERKHRPFERTSQLERILFYAYPPKLRHGKIHPATRGFQALRMAVNQELQALERAIPRLASLLAPGGRLAIISFHSLEDRLVKVSFKELARSQDFELLTPRPITPSPRERASNRRCRSAKMRVMARGEGLEKTSAGD